MDGEATFRARRVGTTGHEIMGPAGIFAWTTDDRHGRRSSSGCSTVPLAISSRGRSPSARRTTGPEPRSLPRRSPSRRARPQQPRSATCRIISPSSPWASPPTIRPRTRPSERGPRTWSAWKVTSPNSSPATCCKVAVAAPGDTRPLTLLEPDPGQSGRRSATPAARGEIRPTRGLSPDIVPVRGSQPL